MSKYFRVKPVDQFIAMESNTIKMYKMCTRIQCIQLMEIKNNII